MRRAIALAASLGLAACTVGPDFHAPSFLAPLAWWERAPQSVSSVTVAEAIDAAWWRSFGDPELTSLIDRLAAQNLDLQEAAERVRQGRAQTRVAASAGLPGISYNASEMRERQSPAGPFGLFQIAPGAPAEFDDYRQGLSASWELDLFGRVRRSVEAQQANTEAAAEARNAVALSAAAELATDYIQLRGVQARIEIAERNLALADRNVSLVGDRVANGVAATLEMAQARAQRATIAQTVPPLRRQQAELVNAIGFLLGAQPRALEAELGPAPLPPVPPVIPIGLPGDVVRRRPDIREAEARLHAATAETGVAVANFYPDIRLTGDFSLEGLALKNAFSLPDRAFSVGPTLSLPIFQGGRLRGTLELRKSQQREAAIAFQRTVLQAWQEVDNAMTAYAEAQRARRDAVDAVAQNRAALAAATQRYREGVADFLNVTNSEAAVLQSENAVSQIDTEIDTDLVRLYRTLGGGWAQVLAAPGPAK